MYIDVKQGIEKKEKKCFHKSTWEQNHRTSGIYTNNHYASLLCILSL